ncbi:uncharacterized protein LY79DRAFT_165649 [Colletotrichum navitas]|uniref:Uncharacterized protein n=1 Tax=Colletotrichum navitas TaxID=681940 RepID=A0AAD8Q1Z7_9PEZI|nr:uncharacterized protein LY79DRAFT_165649 [Colletotrichum navitas]KAK1593980.1 hypothetical protein LY79DRAFT_165649 [Colletotrichum navitas]
MWWHQMRKTFLGAGRDAAGAACRPSRLDHLQCLCISCHFIATSTAACIPWGGVTMSSPTYDVGWIGWLVGCFVDTRCAISHVASYIMPLASSDLGSCREHTHARPPRRYLSTSNCPVGSPRDASSHAHARRAVHALQTLPSVTVARRLRKPHAATLIFSWAVLSRDPPECDGRLRKMGAGLM